MMGMDGRDSAECQSWEKKDIGVILEKFKSQKDKKATVVSYLMKLKPKNMGEQNLRSSSHFWEIFFRGRNFSLDLRQIRPLAVFGTRRRTALCGEGFAWVPDLGSFLKLLEIGVFLYLSFILRLSVFTMFALNEAVMGRLIGSKAWNRGVGF